MVNIHWLELWRKLVDHRLIYATRNKGSERYRNHTRKKVERSDPLLDFVLRDVDCKTTIIDVGAGNGRWTIPLAKKAKNVTAVEPAEEMCALLTDRMNKANLNNIQIIPKTWREAMVDTHDVVVCAHAIYTSPDLAQFVKKMEQYARRRCYLSIRLPPYDGIIGELSTLIYGQPNDSPNALIAYNSLYSLGIYVNVFVEEGIQHWQNATLEEAFARAKRHLRLNDSVAYDDLIRSTLIRRLNRVKGSFLWPDGMRSALLWWNPRTLAKNQQKPYTNPIEKTE